MRWVPAPLEIACYMAIAVLGGFLLCKGVTDQATVTLLGGALCMMIGTMILVIAIRNFLRHGRMLRKHTLNRQSDLD